MLPIRVRGGVACLLVLFVACNTRRGAPGPEASATPASAAPGSPQGAASADSKPATLPEVALPVTANVSAAPLAALSLSTRGEAKNKAKNGATPLSFNLALHHPVFLNVGLPSGETWKTANVGQLVARLPGGKVRSLSVAADGSVSFKGEQPGAAMLVGCVGPSAKGLSDAWQRVTHCTKTILRVGDVAEHSPALDAGITTKVGVPVEITPFSSPLGLRVGEELTVKLHTNMGARSDTEIIAIRPDGSVERQMSDRRATARFKINQAGHWLLRYVDTQSEFKRTAELAFEIQPEKPVSGSDNHVKAPDSPTKAPSSHTKGEAQ